MLESSQFFHEYRQITKEEMKCILLFCREGDIYDDVDYRRGKFSLNSILKTFYAIHDMNF